MLGVGKNQHRWKKWVDARTRDVLEDAAKSLKWAWSVDRKSPTTYPVNTEYQFWEIDESLRGQPKEQRAIRFRRPPPPQSFADLIRDKTIGAAYEDHNQGSYKAALKQAALGHGKGHAAWRKILRAADQAYEIEYFGYEYVPKPRVHFLHRNLLRVLAASEQLRDLSDQGIAELFDDLCPCGKSHKPDAIRKLKRRLRDLRQPPR